LLGTAAHKASLDFVYGGFASKEIAACHADGKQD
jgi:hypothetical protein